MRLEIAVRISLFCRELEVEGTLQSPQKQRRCRLRGRLQDRCVGVIFFTCPEDQGSHQRLG